jgi:hypothetical protein
MFPDRVAKPKDVDEKGFTSNAVDYTGTVDIEVSLPPCGVDGLCG